MSRKQVLSPKSAFLWNMIGSTCYSLSSILFLMVVTCVCGITEAGSFSLAYASAQLLLSVGRYGMRTFQATDLKEQFCFREYVFSRIITVSFMMLIGIVYSFLFFDEKYAWISLLVIAMKAIDAIEDVYHGRLQQSLHTEKMGQSQTIRNAYTTICFVGLLVMTKSLLITLSFTVASSLVLCIVVNQFMICHYTCTTTTKRKNMLKTTFLLLRNCTGIFVGTFLSLLIYNIPKYALDGILSADYQTYYSILFMPSFVLTLLCEFVFKPTITSLSNIWFSGNKNLFGKIVLLIYGVLIAMTAVVVLGGHFIGRYLLEILYNVHLDAFVWHFIVLLIGGGISSCVYISYNILIAIRHKRSITIIYGAVAGVSIFTARPLIRCFSMMGAALNYLLSGTLLLVSFVIVLIYVYKYRKQ